MGSVTLTRLTEGVDVSGESAAERAAAKRVTAARYRNRAERAERSAGHWEQGSQGELALAELSALLGADGYHRLDDRRIGTSKANIDHVLIGRAGVFVIDAKNWTGELSIDGKSLRQDGRRRDDHLERARDQAVDVATVIEEVMGPRQVEVRPVICFTGEARLSARAAIDRVHLVNHEELVPFIRGLEPRLEQSNVDQVTRVLLDRLPPRTAPVAAAPDVVAAPRAVTTPPAPHELVLFLQPWAKHGHRRLYVKDTNGGEVGHLDLVSGHVESAEGWKPVLAQLLPHYATDAPGALEAEALSSGARSVFRRFLHAVRGRPDAPTLPPILAAYHWRNYGKARLYVHKIEGSGAKIDLGWFDLKSGLAQGNDPTATAMVEYCGATFRTF